MRYDRAEWLATEYEQCLSAGTDLVVIGQAEPERARRYAAEVGIPCPILCDPDCEAYRAFGLREGSATQVIHPDLDNCFRDYAQRNETPQSLPSC